MRVTVNGKIVSVLEKRTGVSKSGSEWASQDYVIQPDGDDDVICFNVFGENNIADYNLHVGSVVSVTLVIASREYNGKYYPSIKAVQCFAQSNGANTSAPSAEASTQSPDPSHLPF